MLIGSHDVVVSLLPGRLSAALIKGGEVVREEIIHLDGIDWEQAWDEGLMPFDSALRQALSRLRPGKRVPISVLYSSTAAAVNCYLIKGEKRDARAAAMAKVQESESAGLMHTVHVVSAVGGDEKEWAVLAVSEREELANKIYAWVARCGGNLECVLPLQAAAALTAAEFASDSDEPRAYCVIGQEWTAVACGSKDGVRLIRVFELGYRALSSVYQRVEENSSFIEAERRLLEIGLPFKNKTIDGELRTALLAQLSPIVQRFCIEVKQTLRFGLDAETMPSDLHLAGRGAWIPGLPGSLIEGVDLHARVSPKLDEKATDEMFGTGTIHGWFAENLDSDAVLRPAPMVAQRGMDRFRRATVCGFVLGALAVGGEYAYVKAQQADLRPQFESMSADVAQFASERETLATAHEIAMRAGQCTALLDSTRAESVRVSDVMAMLSGAVSDSARIEHTEIRMEHGEIVLSLRGQTVGRTDERAGAAFQAFVESLEASDLALSLEMGTIDRDSHVEGKFTRRFTLTMRLASDAPDYAPLSRFAFVEEDDS